MAARPTFDLASLHTEIEAERTRRGFTKQRLAGAIGIAPSTIARTALGGVMEADGVLAMVRWLGVPPEGIVRPVATGQPTRLPRSPGVIVRADTLAMHEALDRRRAERGISWEVVAKELGSPRLATELAALQRGGRTTIGTLAAAAQWLGLPLVALTRESDV